MWGLILLLIVMGAIAAVFFVPALKGYRTVLLGYITTGLGFVAPLLTEITGYLQGLDWREYVLSADRKNLIVLAIVGGLGVLMIIMRHLTKGPVGEK